MSATAGSHITAITYCLLAAISIAVIPLGPFTALPLLRMAPTVVLAAIALRAKTWSVAAAGAAGRSCSRSP